MVPAVHLIYIKPWYTKCFAKSSAHSYSSATYSTQLPVSARMKKDEQHANHTVFRTIKAGAPSLFTPGSRATSTICLVNQFRRLHSRGSCRSEAEAARLNTHDSRDGKAIVTTLLISDPLPGPARSSSVAVAQWHRYLGDGVEIG